MTSDGESSPASDAELVRRMDEVTLDVAAAAAGTTRQTAIRMFGGKEDLLRAVARRMAQEIAVRRTVPAGATPRQPNASHNCLS